MKKIFLIVILFITLVLIIAPIGFSKENIDHSEFFKKRLAKLTHQMIVEILIEDREEMRYPLRSEKEIRNVLNLIFNGKEVKKVKEIKRKIFEDIDYLSCSFLEEIFGYIEYKKTLTLYYIILGLLSNQYGTDNYFELAWYLYDDLDSTPKDNFYIQKLDSHFTLRLTSLFVYCEQNRFQKDLCFREINSYLIECCKYLQYIPKRVRFHRYIKQLEYLVKECTKVDYLTQPGDTYWSLARYVREKSDLPTEILKDEVLISELALGIDQDLQSKGIDRFEVGERVELYDAGYYISILIDEESLQ